MAARRPGLMVATKARSHQRRSAQHFNSRFIWYNIGMRNSTERERSTTARAAGLAILAVLAGAAPAWAEPSFPRGTGYYYNPYNFGIFLLAYLLWVRLCSWVDEDVNDVGLEPIPWNPLLVGAGAAGLLAVWIAPQFWIGLTIFLVLLAGAFGFYAYTRNRRVDQDER